MATKITKQDLWLLIVWVAIGLGLRLFNLTLKPVWGDEWATLIFSLGHGFAGIPVDQLISAEALLEPLRFQSETASIASVTESLLTESNHPPLYFWLTHWWLRIWSEDSQYILIWAGRSLSALFGTLLIPLGFSLGKFCFQKKRIAHIAALAIAISPFAVYLSQEARHYSLAMVWISLSLGCLIEIVRAVKQGRSPSYLLIIFWLLVNSLGVASHYFMVFQIWSQGLVLLGFYLSDQKIWNQKSGWFRAIGSGFLLRPWRCVSVGIIANVVMILLLLNHWSGNSDSKLTSWLTEDYGWSLEALAPLGRLLLWLWGMFFSFPLEAGSLWIVVSAAIATLGVLIWLTPYFYKAIRSLAETLECQIFLGMIVANIVTFLGLIYLLKLDVSLAPRYQFVYLPAVLLIFAAVFNVLWQRNQKVFNAIIALMFFSSLMTNFDLAYRKPENTKAIANLIDVHSGSHPVVIATRDRRAAELRSLLGIAWELHSQDSSTEPSFFILSQENRDPSKLLSQSRQAFQETFELWMINTPISPNPEECDRLPEPQTKVTGFSHKKYLCKYQANQT